MVPEGALWFPVSIACVFIRIFINWERQPSSNQPKRNREFMCSSNWCWKADCGFTRGWIQDPRGPHLNLIPQLYLLHYRLHSVSRLSSLMAEMVTHHSDLYILPALQSLGKELPLWAPIEVPGTHQLTVLVWVTCLLGTRVRFLRKNWKIRC